MAVLVLPISVATAQSVKFTSRTVGGSLQKVTTVNLSDLAKTTPNAGAPSNTAAPSLNLPEHVNRFPVLRPPVQNGGQKVFSPASSIPSGPTTSAPAPSFRGFTGLTHRDSRFARNGNQFSEEPPDQGLAVGNGFVVEAINSVLQIYDISGHQLLVNNVALTSFFGLPPAIDRSTGKIGPALPGDPVVVFDPDTGTWYIEAWSQFMAPDGTGLQKSGIFLAVSQTSDPRGAYTLYTLDTTDANDPDGLGPRIPDYAKLGFDSNGFYISANEFGINPDGSFDGFFDVAIYAFNKAALVAGTTPTVVRISLPFFTGYEFTILPAFIPPGASQFTNNGGVEFFTSSEFVFNTENTIGVWALTNTSSLNSTPNLGLQLFIVNTLTYNFPSQNVVQKDGFRPLGESLGEPVSTLDAGDFRMLSLMYSAGELWCTLGTEITDTAGNQQMAAAFFDVVPKIVNGNLSASVRSQGVISKTGTSLLRPAIAINNSRNGGMVFTLVGPNNFPSSAFVPFTGSSHGGITIARAGNEPEDGFTGYPEFTGGNTARWGDYSFGGVDADGSILLATEYVPDIARSSLANFATYITRIQE